MKAFDVFKQDVELIRKQAGSWVDGFWQAGSFEKQVIRASVQPANQEDVELLPAGRVLTGTFRLFTFLDLVAAEEGKTINSDKIIWQGRVYEVLAQIKWKNNIINNNVYLMTKTVDSLPDDFELDLEEEEESD